MRAAAAQTAELVSASSCQEGTVIPSTPRPQGYKHSRACQPTHSRACQPTTDIEYTFYQKLNSYDMFALVFHFGFIAA
jgi:hypothetical protein